MVEESIPTFEAFCRHHDVATLAADQQYLGQYEEIVRSYAGYAALKMPVQPKGGLTTPIAVRWRSAGLRALKSITSSEAVGADGGRQMNIIMPVVLQNLHSRDEEHLCELQRKVEAVETEDEKQARRRRMSIATVQTTDGNSRPSSGAVTGTVDDADVLAEEEVRLQALQSLKEIFMANSRNQIRLATGAMLKFFCTVPQRRPGTSKSTRSVHDPSWATVLMEMCTRWTPVQDRFVILVTVMETLVRSPIAEENMEQQLLLVSLAGWLLRSNINMIGLSVMDVLLGLVQHILLILQLGGKGSNVLPHHQQTDAIDLFKGTEDLLEGPTSLGSGDMDGTKAEESLPSSNRQELLSKLHRCIGDLATHVYYSDQISDMITAILLRLKPSPMSGVATAAAAIEDPQAAARAIQASVHLQENPETDEFFSFGTARVTALKAIMEVLTVANLKGTASGGAAIGRNRVGVQVWEGTQWLLRDEDRRVRRAYIDAILTWLRLEMSSNDLHVLEDKRALTTTSKSDIKSSRQDTTTRRAVSSASKGEKNGKPAKSTFLQLLHLAVYDNAIEAPESGPDLLLVHLLLFRLVEKLGVNAVKTGLPMIMRLQEDINVDELMSTPVAKLNIGSLVHGYFWTLCEKFDFDTSNVGFAVQREISRRKQHGLWLDAIQVPPLPLEQILSAASRPLSEKLSLPTLQQESLRPFDSRSAMVDRIADSYASTVASPPTSPPASPGRVFSLPPISSQSPSTTSLKGNTRELPRRVIELMLSDWSKEICIANVEKESTRTISLSSRNGTNLSKYLGVNGQSSRGISPNGDRSPNQSRSPPNENDITSQPHALNFAFQSQHRRSSAHDTGSPTPVSSSEQNSTLRVDDLKRVLAGGTLNTRGASPLRYSTARHDFTPSENNDRRSISSSSESVVSAESFESASEGPGPNPPAETAASNPPALASNNAASSTHSRTSWVTHPRSRPQSGEISPGKSSTPRSLRRPSTSSSGEDPTANAAALRGEIVHPRLSGEDFLEDEVPPVPPLPANVTAFPNRPLSTGNPPVQSQYQHHYADPMSDGVKQSKHASTGRKRGVDVNALLGSIDAVSVGERRIGSGVGRPPY